MSYSWLNVDFIWYQSNPYSNQVPLHNVIKTQLCEHDTTLDISNKNKHPFSTSEVILGKT